MRILYLAPLLTIPDLGTASLPSASAFVHLFEWSWSDVALECEHFLGPKGYTAVQISPPSEHIIGNEWWTRYQPVTYNLTSRSGDENAFKDMVDRCNKVGVGIYADAVFNHVAAGSGTGIAGSKYGNRQTPLYDQADFHHNGQDLSSNCEVSNYQDKWNVQNCDLVGLPDLCTGCQKVQGTISRYLEKLLSLGVKGFRIDAAKHQDASQLAELLSQVSGPKPYIFQEVISGVNEAVTTSMYTSIGQVSEFGYARQLDPNFLNMGKLKYLDSFGEKWGLMNSANAVVFLDNHDTQRGEAQLTYKSGALYTFANIFMLAHPYGYPKVMSSYYFSQKDQGPPMVPVYTSSGSSCMDGQNWVCEHRIPEIANMVGWRKVAGDAAITSFVSSDDGNGIMFCRGSNACVALNRATSPWNVRLKFTLAPGDYHDVLRADDVSHCPTVTVDGQGFANIEVPALNGVALHVDAARSKLQAVVV
jgi:alpha-amylase